MLPHPLGRNNLGLRNRVPYLQLIQSMAGWVYYPLDDAFTTAAGSLDELLGNSDGTFDRGETGGEFLAQDTVINPVIGNFSARCIFVSDLPAIATGDHLPPDQTDLSYNIWVKATTDVQAGITFFDLSGAAFDFNSGMRIGTHNGIDDIQFATAGTPSFNKLLNNVITWTDLNLLSMSQKKVGATWDYRWYINAVEVATQIGAGQYFGGAGGINADNLTLGPTNTTDNETRFQGFSIHASAEGLGGALTPAEFQLINSYRP